MRPINILLLLTLTSATVQAQTPTANHDLAPFFHGVASGDPLTDRVILWTRVTAENESVVSVEWEVAADAGFTEAVNAGVTTTDAAQDYTVKVDAQGLAPGTTYFYRFRALGRYSIIGRTRTAPEGAISHLRFGVVSCANLPAGYFNAYARLAERADLDAVIHLGDYLYEYGNGTYGGERPVEPETELITLGDYRLRHSTYKLDADLRAVHQQHPFIAVWDDHESANNSYRDGAQNHQPDTEGDWTDRKRAAIRAYYEWMPIRAVDPSNPERIYRTLRYGDLADLIMIDTRLYGRDRQLPAEGGIFATDIDTAAWFANDRTILGDDQFEWLTNQLSDSDATWRVIGNQVMMVQLAPNPALPGNFQVANMDAWDGYPAERQRLFNHVAENDIDNVVVLTGDIHSSWAADLSLDSYDPAEYKPETGEGTLAVEYVVTSVTSSTFGDVAVAATGFPLQAIELLIRSALPQIKAFDLSQRGYFILDLRPEKAQADWFFVDYRQPSPDQREGFQVYTESANNHLQIAAEPASEKSDPPPLAPTDLPATSIPRELPPSDPNFVVLGHYPNPTRQSTIIIYSLPKPTNLRVSLIDVMGREVLELQSGAKGPGTHELRVDVSFLSPGRYWLRLATPQLTETLAVVVQ